MNQRADFDRELAILREDLAELVAKTPGADRLAPPGAFIGPPKKRGAAWRRVEDDADAGRLSYRAAHFAAEHGLAALDAVEVARAAILDNVEDTDALERLCAEIDAGVELARAAAAHAAALYIDAVERIAGARGLAALRESARERGRKASAESGGDILRLAEAVERLRAADTTLTAKKARAKALDDDPRLAEAFGGHTDHALRKALSRKN